MALRLQIVSRHRQGLGERSSMEFGRNGGTIGRSLESDWVLPDSLRYLSSRHASIDYRSGSYYIVDTSTNGVYVNDAEQPVGRGNPQRLFTGDRVRLGDYELSVEIADEDDTSANLTDGLHVDPVSRAARVPPPDPTRADLVAPHEITAVGIEMLISDEVEIGQVQRIAKANGASLRLQDDPPPASVPHDQSPTGERGEPPVSAAARIAQRAAKPAPKPANVADAASPPKETAAPTAPAMAQRPPPAAPLPAPAPSPTAAAPQAALDAFFRGAGLAAPKLDAKATEQLLHRLGQMLREVVVGLTENLHLRSEQKALLRVPTTTIQPQNNNPLKFSAGVEEALQNLLFRESSEYLSAVEAVRETFGDLKQHQQQLLSAVRAAVVDYAARLDPDEIESKIGHGKTGALLHAAHKLKYWDLYKDLFVVVTQSQPGQFPQQFLEELSRAYENESARAVPHSSAARRAKLG
jgi:type VI secretion system protein